MVIGSNPPTSPPGVSTPARTAGNESVKRSDSELSQLVKVDSDVADLSALQAGSILDPNTSEEISSLRSVASSAETGLSPNKSASPISRALDKIVESVTKLTVKEFGGEATIKARDGNAKVTVGNGKRLGAGGFNDVFSLKLKGDDASDLPEVVIKVPTYGGGESEAEAYQVQRDALGDRAVDFRSFFPVVSDGLGREKKECIVMEKVSNNFEDMFEKDIGQLSPSQVKTAEDQLPNELNEVIRRLTTFDKSNPEKVLGDLSPDNIGIKYDEYSEKWNVVVLDANLADNDGVSTSGLEFANRFREAYNADGIQPLKLQFEDGVNGGPSRVVSAKIEVPD